MELKVTQNWCGKYYLGSSEEQFSFYMGIYHEGKLVEEDGIKAQIHYMGEPDDADEFRNPIEDITHVFEKCFQYSQNVISTANYKGNTLLFSKLYLRHFHEIQQTYKEQKEKEIRDEIERLQQRLDRGVGLGEITWEANNEISKFIDLRTKWKEGHVTKLNDFKKNTDSWKKESEQIEKYQTEIDKYQSVKNHIDLCENINGAATDGLEYLDHYGLDLKLDINDAEWDKLTTIERVNLLHEKVV